MSSSCMCCLIGLDRLRPAAESGGARGWPSHLASRERRQSCTRSQGHLKPQNRTVLRATLMWSLQGAALAIGQWDGERDAELLTDAPGDVPVAGQVFGHQDVTR